MESIEMKAAELEDAPPEKLHGVSDIVILTKPLAGSLSGCDSPVDGIENKGMVAFEHGKAFRTLGLTDESARRDRALRRLGVQEEDVELAKRVMLEGTTRRRLSGTVPPVELDVRCGYAVEAALVAPGASGDAVTAAGLGKYNRVLGVEDDAILREKGLKTLGLSEDELALDKAQRLGSISDSRIDFVAHLSALSAEEEVDELSSVPRNHSALSCFPCAGCATVVDAADYTDDGTASAGGLNALNEGRCSVGGSRGGSRQGSRAGSLSPRSPSSPSLGGVLAVQLHHVAGSSLTRKASNTLGVGREGVEREKALLVLGLTEDAVQAAAPVFRERARDFALTPVPAPRARITGAAAVETFTSRSSSAAPASLLEGGAEETKGETRSYWPPCPPARVVLSPDPGSDNAVAADRTFCPIVAGEDDFHATGMEPQISSPVLGCSVQAVHNSKAEKLTGYSAVQRSRSRALRRLGANEDDVDDYRASFLGALGLPTGVGDAQATLAT